MNYLLIVALSLVSAGDGENWPAFRGRGASHSKAVNLPLHWGNDRGIAWSADLPGYGQSSPVVWQGRVFVTTMQGDKKERPVVFCFDLKTGEKLWERAFTSTQQVEASNYVSRGAPTPAVDKQRVYAFFESGNLVALDHAGNEIWQRSLTADYGEFRGNHGIGSSLAVTADAVIVLIDHDGPSYLLAVDKKTGKNIWKTEREKKVSWTSPVVSPGAEGDEILVSSSGTVEAFDAQSGKRQWVVAGLEGNHVPSASASSELVVVGSSAAGSNLAVNRGGRGDVSNSHVAWRLDGAASSFGSPLVYGGQAYFVSRAGVVLCVDAATGKECWQHRVGDSCWASPLAAGDRIYFFTKSGATIVVATGSELKVLAENELPSEDPVCGVAAVNGRFVIRAPRKLVCIDGAKIAASQAP